MDAKLLTSFMICIENNKFIFTLCYVSCVLIYYHLYNKYKHRDIKSILPTNITTPNSFVVDLFVIVEFICGVYKTSFIDHKHIQLLNTYQNQKSDELVTKLDELFNLATHDIITNHLTTEFKNTLFQFITERTLIIFIYNHLSTLSTSGHHYDTE